MKILQIRFCNLNSLAGNWSINLAAQEYTTHGIFAITGPTGAGKTTILDAICLALYGQTPRLDKVNKASNEIMTRQTGECWAEVEFTTARGTYRCHWAQHRSRRAAAGDLQPSRHEIVDCHSGKVLESRKKQVEQKVIEVTGMSYQQFTRSILLAQGEFNTFLNARPDERAPILEQITGTDVYSRISRKVHEIKSRNQSTFDQLQVECAGFIPLSAERVTELNHRRDELSRQGQQMEQELKALQSLLDWLQLQEQLSREITSQEQQLQSATAQWQQLSSQRDRLERGEKAEKLRPAYDHLVATRTLQEREKQEQDNTRQELNRLAESIKEAHADREKLKSVLTNRAQEDARLETVIRKIRELDRELTLTRKQHDEHQKERETGLKQQQNLFSQTRATVAELTKIAQEQAAITRYFENNGNDKLLVSELSGIEQYSTGYLQLVTQTAELKRRIADGIRKLEQDAKQMATSQEHHKELLSRLTALQKEEQGVQDKLAELLSQHNLDSIEALFQLERTLQADTRLLEQLSDQHRHLTTEIDKFTQANTLIDKLNKEKFELENRIQATQNEYQLRKLAVQKQEQVLRLAAKVQSLEEERRKLKAGSPCPLCGATEHPYLSSDCPQTDAEEQLLKREQDLLEKSRQQLTELTNASAAVMAKREQLQQTLAESQLCIEQSRDKRDLLATQLEFTVTPNLDQQLTERQTKLNSRITQLQELQQHCLNLTKTGEKLRTELEVAGKAVNEAERSLQRQLHEHDNLTRFHQQLVENHQENCARCKEQLRELQDKLKPYLSADLQALTLPAALPQCISELKSRQQQWLEAEAREQQLAATVQKLHNEKTRLETQSSALEENLTHGLKRLKTSQESIERLTTNRQELFGSKDPDIEERKRLEQRKLLEGQAEKLAASCEQLLQEQAKLSERQSSLQERVTTRESELRQYSQQFAQRLQLAGFTDEADYLASCMEPDKLAEQQKVFEGKRAEIEKIKHLLQNSRIKLTTEQQRKLTEQSANELRDQQEKLTAELRRVAEESGALTQQLRTNEEQQRRHQHKLAQLTKQGELLEQWSQLHELIGSADGKKFRNFAQGLTFELMIHHANLSLRQMTDRYLLVHNTEQPLELHVIDNYQAGEIRSTKNLSGGESFIVSMALALGLSNMASNTVQVDSLFLDEGFGTLDDEALQTALDTLSGLHQTGKLIGVISHISGLQERITTRIQVTKGFGGLSTLAGPGVSGRQ